MPDMADSAGWGTPLGWTLGTLALSWGIGRAHTFADSSVNFTVILRGREFADQYLIEHEFVKRLHARFSREGIVIPFPIRTITQREIASSVPSQGVAAGA
jgi:hypothetical protein